MNNYGLNFTYIIAYRHKMDRLQNLKRVLDWINGFSGVEVIIVEQDKHSKISHLNLKARHIFTRSNLPFNKSHAFNVGTRYAKTDIIVFGDSDLIMHPDSFINALNTLQNYEMVNPYNSVIDLTHQENSLPLEQIVKINRPGRGETDIQKVPLCGGICLFRRGALARIAGWNEDFIGWGGEDDFESIKVKHFLTWTELQAKCYHLYHEKNIPDSKFYQRNLQLLNKYAVYTKDQHQKAINSLHTKVGIKNKYDNFV